AENGKWKTGNGELRTGQCSSPPSVVCRFWIPGPRFCIAFSLIQIRRRRIMGKYGFQVIDADGHGGDQPNWQARIPAEFQPKWEERREKIKKQFANLPGVGVKETRGKAKLNSLDRPGMTDPKSRLEDMDLEGIDQTIMFPGGAGEEWAGLERDFAITLCRTLNDARAEFTSYKS